MSWNQARYDRGYQAAKELHIGDLGVDANDLREECRNLPPTEYEVGWRQYTLEVLRGADYIEAAKWILECDADLETRQKVARMDERGLGVWVLDPEVEGVVGFVKPGTNKAWAVFYTQDRGDFETSMEFLEEVV